MQLIDTFDRGAGYGLAEPCFIEPGGRTLSYGQVQDMSHRIANGLHATRPNRDSKVGTLSANHLLTFPPRWASSALATWLPVNARNAAEENANILSAAAAGVPVHPQPVRRPAARPAPGPARPEGRGMHRRRLAAKRLRRKDWMARQSAAPASEQRCADRRRRHPRHRRHHRLPKGVLVAHRNYLALVANWLRRHARARTARAPGRRPPFRMRRVRPPCRLAYGGCNVILPTADPAAIIDAIGR